MNEPRKITRNWSAKRITRELRAIGVTKSALADSIGRARTTVSEVACGRLKSLPVATALASALGRHPHDIWPRIYAPPSGEPTTEATGEPAPTALAS